MGSSLQGRTHLLQCVCAGTPRSLRTSEQPWFPLFRPLDWSTGTHDTASMSNVELAPSVMRFYGETVNEDSRLRSSADGRMELARTQELLRRFLPPAPA